MHGLASDPGENAFRNVSARFMMYRNRTDGPLGTYADLNSSLQNCKLASIDWRKTVSQSEHAPSGKTKKYLSYLCFYFLFIAVQIQTPKLQKQKK